MIQRKPSKRLGYNGPSEVKSHPWLASFAWEDLYNKKLKAKFTPRVCFNYILKILEQRR